ncbi:MAG TPA: SDR family NAD(P)-dependent oxidoreductase [Anaerolineaceae bacterium]|nr:SDR family NAD(P)-dependent oxidoreductase [Chloroflexota bacterium]HNY84303.1 SDR family NAD(P)-dependent oxidoreductase [Anaerolineaceae bacterium]
MATYLVTGAAGFIGAALSRHMLNEGHTVLGVDNLSETYDARLKQYRLDLLLAQPGFSFIKADIADPAIFEKISQRKLPFDAIVNLAAMAGVRFSTVDPWSYLHTNVLGMLNMLEFARQHGVKKFIQASSSTVYGAQGKSPYAETSPTDHPMQPYAASKKSAEAYAYAYHYLYKLDVSILRFFNVYGPAGRPDMAIFRFCQWIAEGRPVKVNGDGSQTRGLTFIDDITRGVMQAMRPVGYDIFNLGGHEVISINDLIALLEKKLGRKALVEHGPANPADMLDNQADVRKAGVELGWEPSITLEDGVGRLVDWYRREREWVKDIRTS